jgi:hypothetical protein
MWQLLTNKRVLLWGGVLAVAVFLYRHQLAISAQDLVFVSAGGGFGIEVCVAYWGCEVLTLATNPPADAAPAALPDTDNPAIEI